MSHHHHAIDYIELPVDDVAAAKAFYAAAFGWSFTDYGPEYAGIQHPTEPGEEVGGLNGAGPAGPRGAGPFVLLYSTDLDASVAAVTAAGGTVTEGPYEFPGGRRFHFTDPARNALGVWAEG
jgi:predicted enzyme related to lactoylglutathione lyase